MSTETTETPAADEQLGEAGKNALKAEREARKAAEQRAQAAEQKLADVETKQLRASVASAKGLSDAQAARLSGSTREELEADAAALLEAFAPAEPAEETAATNTRRTPREQLRPGAAPTAEPEKSAADIAAEVLSS